MSWQQVIIIGNVGRTPEVKETQYGNVASFSVAITEKWGSGDNRQEKTTWFNVSAWNKLADIVSQYVSKGSQVMVTGTIDGRPYTGKDGIAKMSLELRATNIQLLFSKQHGNNNDNNFVSEYDNADDSDFPF